MYNMYLIYIHNFICFVVKQPLQLISPQRRLERLFVEDRSPRVDGCTLQEFKKSFFSPNPWYECPEAGNDVVGAWRRSPIPVATRRRSTTTG